MNLKHLLLASLLCIPFNSQAEGLFDNLFYGVAVLNQSVDIQVDTGTSSDSSSESGSGIAIFADKYYQGTYRFDGTVSFTSYDSFDIYMATASADYLFPYNAQLTFFAGGTAGGAMQKYSDSGLADSAAGLVYGVQGGGIMLVTDRIMLELGYQMRFTDLETEFTSSSVTAKAKLDKINQFYLSLYLFF